VTNGIVVGLNSSPGASLALRWAVDEAVLRSAPLRIVHCWLRGSREFAGGEELAHALELQALERATSWIMDALGTVDVPGYVDIVEGPAAAVLVERSRDAALLVVGTQAHIGVQRLLGGSVSHHCLSHAACPVVAIPGPPQRRHLSRAHHRRSARPPGALP